MYFQIAVTTVSSYYTLTSLTKLTLTIVARFTLWELKGFLVKYEKYGILTMYHSATDYIYSSLILLLWTIVVRAIKFTCFKLCYFILARLIFSSHQELFNYYYSVTTTSTMIPTTTQQLQQQQ